MKTNYLACTVIGVLGATLATTHVHADTNISLKTHMGYDSNPYRFNDQFTIESSSFFAYELKAKHEIGKHVRIKAELDSQIYNDNASHGDNQSISTQVRYQTGKKRRPKGIEFNYKQFDKTYVSRLQGGTDTYSGVPLDDRYDFEQMSVSGFTTLKLKKRLYNEMKFKWIDKDYEDFNQIAITDYDYQSFIVKNTLSHTIRKGQYQAFILGYESRLFKNREQKDLQGNEIANTDMVFQYLNLAYQHKYEKIKGVDLGFNLAYKVRNDNGSGYYDSKWMTLGMDSQFKLSKNTKLELAYSFKDFSYDREPLLDNTGLDEEFGSDSKHEFEIKSKTRLPKWVGKRAYWDARYSYLTADSNYTKYTYNRHILETGLKFTF